MIPDAAVEAAFRAIVGGNKVTGPDIAGDFLTTEQITIILEAAAPHMLQTAKRDAWDEGWQKAHATEDPAMVGIFFNPYR